VIMPASLSRNLIYAITPQVYYTFFYRVPYACRPVLAALGAAPGCDHLDSPSEQEQR
jgi:hypothetical protein